MSHGDGITGYAYYIKTSYVTLKGSGAFKMLAHSDKNEMYAVSHALKALKTWATERMVKVENVYLYCDNEAVVTQLTTFSKGDMVVCKDKGYQDRLNAFLITTGLSLIPRKVKAHSGVSCKRTYLNDQMDKAAKQARKIYKKRLGIVNK